MVKKSYKKTPQRSSQRSPMSLPLNRNTSTHLMVWTIAVMAFLTGLALMGVFGLRQIEDKWHLGLTDQLTVEVPYQAKAPIAQGQINQMVADLNKLNGWQAKQISVAELSDMVEPWLGDISQQKLPLPTLVAVEKHALKTPEKTEKLAPKLEPATRDDIARTAQKTIPTAKVDGHESWLKNLLEVTTLIRLAVLVVASILLITAALTVAGAAQTRLALHHEEIDLLHLMGATDQYIARQFLRHGCRIAVEGALIGIILALLTLWLMGALGSTSPNALLPRIALGPAEWLILAAIPVVAGGIAMVASWFTVMRSLKQLP